ncbi:SDR family oxidoreductase [Planctomyces sp. SH-PL14]|uniref:SDR family oxidoreductase n=1 Tax=Planctomyces sp. SH-PL14 TaxID=1632864 RepID=UPI00078C70F9|nr:SDR family oxidoreductase [Planctomyces sp. SH-PL14]AMV17882.1 putative oxidoreductase YghA [Planctomyces sp. SH-PL14]
MSTSAKSPKNPKTAEAQPPFPQPQQPYPGYEDKMSPKADHGEESYKGTGRLQGYGTLITGADSGIGRAVALAFAREGADVVISYLSEDRDANETRRLVEEAGRKAIVARGDIQEEATCRKLVDQAMEEFGRIDVLVNNAAFQTAIEKLEDYTAEHIDRCYRTNVFAMFYLAKAAVPHMKAGASIINTTSIQAYDPSPNLLDYASTKSAIIGFTKALSKLVAPQGIRVNAVAPGPVWTPLIPSTMSEEKTKKFGDNTLFERPAQPGELAPVYVLLASNAASYITGEVYGLTGGRTPY